MRLGIGLGLGFTQRGGGGGGATAPVIDTTDPLEFGRLTLAGAGGVAPPNSGGAITSATIDSGTNANHWQISSAGVISPSSTGVTAGLAASPYTLTCTFTNAGGSDTAVITIETEANTYSVSTAADVSAVSAIASATMAGKTIKLRHGDYLWPAGTSAFFRNKLYPSTVTVTSHDVNNRGRFLIPGVRLDQPTNMTFEYVDWHAELPAAGDAAANGAALTLTGTGTIDGVKWRHCNFTSNFQALMLGSPPPASALAAGWRGIIGGTGTHAGNGIEITDCTFDGSWRALQIVAGTGPVVIQRNEIINVGIDWMILAGNQPNVLITDNIMWKPLIRSGTTYQAASVDVALNRITLTQNHDFGPNGNNVTINIIEPTASVPGGLSINKDYVCEIISSDTIQFPVDITSAGSDIYLWREPDHGDFIQGASGVDAVLKGEIRRNIMAAFRDDDIVTLDNVQGIFIEDLNGGSHPDTTHPNLIIENNVIYARTNQGIFVANSYNSHILNNTVITPPDAPAVSVPAIRFSDHWNGTRAGNVARNNIGPIDTSKVTSGGLTDNNLTVYPDAIDTGATSSYTEAFAAPGFPTTIAELLSMYTLKAGGPADTASPKVGAIGNGYVDWDAHTSTNPNEPSDITGPVLTSVSGTQTGATTADLAATTDAGDGTFYWVVSTSATRPSPAQMLAGQTAAGTSAPYAGSSTVSSSGAQNKAATGLTAETAYYVHALHVDANGNYSVTTVSASSFTTAAAASYSAEAEALFARMTTQPDATRKDLIDDLIVSLKAGATSATDIWAKLDIIYLFAAHEGASAVLNWKGANFNATPSGSPTFTTDRGYTGDGVGAHLATGFYDDGSTATGENWSQDSATLGVWVNQESVGSTAAVVGVIGATNQAQLTPLQSGTARARIHVGTTATVTPGAANRLGWTSGVRSSSTSLVARRNTTAGSALTSASTTPANAEVMILRSNVTYAADRVAAFVLGGALTDAEHTDLYNALNTYLTAIGAN